jgi:hypothetical protein
MPRVIALVAEGKVNTDLSLVQDTANVLQVLD